MSNFEVDFNIYKIDGTDGYKLLFDSDGLTIDSGFYVRSKFAFGVSCHEDNGYVENHGTIRSDATVAAAFSGSANDLQNYGDITGAQIGVALAGYADTLENAAQGKITGSAYGVAFSGNADFAWVDNAGDIYGKTAGVHVSTLGDGGSIENSGTIRSEGDGIDVSLKPGKNTYIENVGGTIRGGVNAVHSEGGNVELHNYGLIDGRILLAAPGEADFVENTGQILGRVLLGGGSDFFDGAGVSSGALSGGTSGAVFGEGGSDRLIGGGHRDKLHGGAGFNTLTGGAGHDQFFFDTALNRSFDHITDFVPGADKIMMSHAIFHGVNAPGHVLSAAMLHVGPGFTTAGQRIDYNPGNGWLTYDSNGSAAGGAHAHFATLDPHLHLHSTDFMVIA